ncbi:hypothetical protein CDAR_463461 [Caerostris darwini]|uniref:Uncharacterized protein n=1 Tax=Caerostris darwini TaxID=1538125 RepID=A0AAV4QWB9_9ARAC|nr:hypothetical protein CDAR_463461 [Caerostris darwini]
MHSLITARRDSRLIHTSPMAIAVLIDTVPNTIGFSTLATYLHIPAVDNYLLKCLPFISCHQWTSTPPLILVTLCHRTRLLCKGVSVVIAVLCSR